MIDYYNQEPGDSIRRRASFFTQNSNYSYIRADEGGYTYKSKYMQLKKGVLGKKSDVAPYGLDSNSPLYTYIQRLADVYLIKRKPCWATMPRPAIPRRWRRLTPYA